MPEEPNQPKKQVIVIGIPRPTMRRELLGLFTQPAITLANIQILHRWRTAVVSLLVLLFVGSAFFTWKASRQWYSIGRELIQEVDEVAGPLRLTEEGLQWRNDKGGVLRVTHGGLTVEFLPDKEPSGVHENFVLSCWQNKVIGAYYQGGKQMMQRHVFTKSQLQEISKQWRENHNEVVDREALEKGLLVTLVFLFPALFFFQLLALSWSLVFFLGIFLLSTLIFRSGARSHFRMVLTGALHFSVVPLFVSMVWYAFAPASWGFDNLFCVAFFLYLVYVFWDARHGMHFQAGEEKQ